MFLNAFALLVLLTIIAAAVAAVVALAGWPGRLAAQRQHPQREAVQAAGWLGLLFPPLWLLAAVWAHVRDGPWGAPAETAAAAVEAPNAGPATDAQAHSPAPEPTTETPEASA